jgi:hypothetical protein
MCVMILIGRLPRHRSFLQTLKFIRAPRNDVTLGRGNPEQFPSPSGEGVGGEAFCGVGITRWHKRFYNIGSDELYDPNWGIAVLRLTQDKLATTSF